MVKIDLRQGNCLQLLKTIPEDSIDLTVTSPPYDKLRSYNGNNELWGEHVWKAVIQDLYRVTKDGGIVVWIVGDATIKGSETSTSFKQALWAIECGFNLHDTMIWDKENFTAIGALKVRYAPVFEYMFVWTKGKIRTFNPIKDKENKRYGEVFYNTVRQADGTTIDGCGKGVKKIAKFGQRHNVWRQAPEKDNNKRLHPAVFPEQIVEDHIVSWSNVGDTVLDPFMGSGTTGVVCKKLDRNFIGMEIDEEYFDLATERIENS